MPKADAPYKFVVQAHMLVRDGDKIVAEWTAGPHELFGATLSEVSDRFEELLAAGLAQMLPEQGGTHDAPHA